MSELRDAREILREVFAAESHNEAIAAIQTAQREAVETCASYLDGYAGGHYMAQSCAEALRALIPSQRREDGE